MRLTSGQRYAQRWLPAWLLLTAVLAALAGWWAQASLAQSLQRQLQQQLPARLNEALQNRFDEHRLFALVQEKVDRDLLSLSASGPLPLLQQCRARVTGLVAEPQRRDGDLAIDWQLGETPQRTTLALDCDIRWPVLLGSQGLLALALLAALFALPRPLSPAQRARTAELAAAGIPRWRARQLAGQLDSLNPVQAALFDELRTEFLAVPEVLLDWLMRGDVAALTSQQLDWFRTARQRGVELDACLAVARAPAAIHFDGARHRVTVHGVEVTLSKTPFFYFLWYAQLRARGDGWLANPPVNRPQRAGADELAELMERCGGHNKAINDLRENGLRAKTLDQNRNKIKDELTTALGETLAADYLFETERDPRSGRYRYRLRTEAAQIRFGAGLELAAAIH